MHDFTGDGTDLEALREHIRGMDDSMLIRYGCIAVRLFEKCAGARVHLIEVLTEWERRHPHGRSNSVLI